MKFSILTALLIVTLLSGCNSTPRPTNINLKKYPRCKGVRIHTQRDGSLSPRDSATLVRCYKGMKRYYEKRDDIYNRIMDVK